MKQETRELTVLIKRTQNTRKTIFKKLLKMQTHHSETFGKAKKMQQFMLKIFKENWNLETKE